VNPTKTRDMISGIPLKLHKNVNPTKTRDNDLRHSVKITHFHVILTECLRSCPVLVRFTFLCNFNGMPEIMPGFSGVHVFM
jgi:hypothetical protein